MACRSFSLPLAFLILAAALPAADPPVLLLPFPDGDARYFLEKDGSLHFGNHAERKLYRTEADHSLSLAQDMSGWYVLDATWLSGRFIFCSRQRLVAREGKKIVSIPVPGSGSLVSLCTDGKILYLLDEGLEGSAPLIHRAESGGRILGSFPAPCRNPLYLRSHAGSLWLYDQADKCVHRLDPSTGRATGRIHTPVGHSWAKGFLFLGGQLYVHDRARSALVPVIWREAGKAILSNETEAQWSFVNLSRNTDKAKDLFADFRLPLPPDSAGVSILGMELLGPPDRIEADPFGQRIAFWEGLRIPPRSSHSLGYEVHSLSASVQYCLEEQPLTALEGLPPELQKLHLGADSYINLDEPSLVQAAAAARRGAEGSEPLGVKALVENIVSWIIERMEYDMDDSWDDAAAVLARGTGSCSEYSFLFSALARLNGIATRLAGGIQLDESLHRWTEIWYPGSGWVPVDVTKIDSSEEDSRDWEYLFGKSWEEIPLSLVGNPDASPLEESFYLYRRYRGGSREQEAKISVASALPLGIGPEIPYGPLR